MRHDLHNKYITTASDRTNEPKLDINNKILDSTKTKILLYF